MDLVAILLNVVVAILSLSVGLLCLKVGKATGNLNWWVSFTVGWILIGFARILTAVTYTDILPALFRNASTSLVLFALIMMFVGMVGFTRVMTRRQKH